jgi:hypothetical protein
MRTLFTAAVAALVLMAGACSEDPGQPRDTAISQAEAEALALVVSEDLASLPEVADYDPVTAPLLSADPRDPRDFNPECVTRSPDPVVDSDGDHVPDFVQITYDDCVHSRGDASVTVNGVIEVSDRNPSTPDHSIKWEIVDLTRAVTIRERTTESVENGIKLVSASASLLEHQLVDFRTDVTFPSGETASHEKDWATTFTADVEGTIARRARLPSGTWVIDGTSSWTHGQRSSSLDVSTLEPLHFNASCDVRPRLDAGTLRMVVTRGDRTGTVTIEYTACGQYTVTRS